MTMTRRGRVRTATLLAAVVASVLGWPAAARATEVTVTTAPGQVHQGDAVEVTFVLPEERPGARTDRIEITLPADAPVGEVYPMSVPGWAPRITTRTLDQPVAGMHAAGVDRVTDAVVWTRAPGAQAGPARLALAMGPMPWTERLSFRVVQRYSDGTVVRWADPAGGAHPAPALTLLPPAPGSDLAGHTGHGGTGDSPAGAAVEAPAAPPAADDPDTPNADLLLGAGLLAGLGGGAAIGWLLSRWRRGGMAFAPEENEDLGGSGAPAVVPAAAATAEPGQPRR
ncbi:YcnI family protein [Micromonospora rhizosphaerae]|nr:YcnI family protein [Micromonospora rhizosphaerae]